MTVPTLANISTEALTHLATAAARYRLNTAGTILTHGAAVSDISAEWTCFCGNGPTFGDGFLHSDENGVELDEPFGDEVGFYLCTDCGRVFRAHGTEAPGQIVRDRTLRFGPADGQIVAWVCPDLCGFISVDLCLTDKGRADHAASIARQHAANGCGDPTFNDAEWVDLPGYIAFNRTRFALAVQPEVIGAAKQGEPGWNPSPFECPMCGGLSNVAVPDFDFNDTEQCDSCLIDGLDEDEVAALIARIRTEIYPHYDGRDGFLSDPGGLLGMFMPEVDDKLAYAAIALINVNDPEPTEVEEPGSEYTVFGLVVHNEFHVAVVLLGDHYSADSEFSDGITFERWARGVRAADVQQATALALAKVRAAADAVPGL